LTIRRKETITKLTFSVSSFCKSVAALVSLETNVSVVSTSGFAFFSASGSESSFSGFSSLSSEM
jgi:hypothetical protein